MTFDEIIERNGVRYGVRVECDNAMGAPWEEYDGHGTVSCWTRRAKNPGERVLIKDRVSSRYYDFQGACRTALRDGWGVEGGRKEGESARAYASRAAERDFQRLRDWCNDGWCWIGIIVHRLNGDDETTGEASLWEIESDCGDYRETVIGELIAEIGC